jgi:hypothetical protein
MQVGLDEICSIAKVERGKPTSCRDCHTREVESDDSCALLSKDQALVRLLTAVRRQIKIFWVGADGSVSIRVELMKVGGGGLRPLMPNSIA